MIYSKSKIKGDEPDLDALTLCSSSLMRFGAQQPGLSNLVELSPRSLFFFSSRAKASFLPWRLTIVENFKKR
jgi:hypothetical protein